VSIDSVGDDNLNFITYISKQAKFIIVRDKFSYNVFSNYKNENLMIAPDLTFLYPYKPDFNSNIKNTVAISLRPWKPNPFKQYTKNYHRFNKLTHKLPLIKKLFGLWNIEKFTSMVKKETSHVIKPFPLHINDKNGDNLLMQKYFEADKKISFNINDLKQSQYLIGMRLHSLIFATQLGVPFIALSYASKINNYLEDIGMSDYLLSVSRYKDLPKRVQLLKKEKEAISLRLLKTSVTNEIEVNRVVDEAFKTYIL
jgi:polysaccharide pyruvyl transferase WcaK-like protein